MEFATTRQSRAPGETDRARDADLVERLKDRSESAFTDLVTLYGGKLYSVGLRILRNSHDAEDAVQQTLLSTVRNMDRFREQSSLYTWLYRILCNEAFAILRKQRREKTVSIEPYLPAFEQGQYLQAPADWTALPDAVLTSLEVRQYFEQGVEELPEELRIAYILKDMEALPENRVCEILGISRPAMKNRVHRARLVLRKRIEERFLS